jgi:glycosyltransferase involved in cell wall biosynthesis
MKVILSVDSVKFPLTGIGRYTHELAKQLQLQPDFELLLFANGHVVEEMLDYSQVEINNTIKSGLTNWLKNLLLKSNIAVKTYQMLIELRSKNALYGYESSIFHGPSYYLPKFTGCSVATFHDLSIFTHAQYHSPERVRFMLRELNLTLKRASFLITDSEYTRQELSAYFGYPLDRIRAIPLACTDAFHSRVAAETSPILLRYGLKHQSYTLFAGTIEPRKNIDTLLDVYAALPEVTRHQWPLVLAGYRGWQSEDLHARIKVAVSEGWLYYLGYVASDDLPYLFAGARLFVFPSFYEGFGLPVLEAMSSGVPVVCSNSSSLPEVVGDAAAMCDAKDVRALHSLIEIGLNDALWRKQAIEKGLLQAKKFSWKKCAEQTVGVYRELINSKNYKVY